ncbi:ArsR/SmtB family transcription factor [Streptomyces gibsoniae]|uniref:Winged helix-turn-helix domain-containing protein n=1 Tax=Streptomyces gibsoniae TaxID=3075529 RepID=A0ABU2TZP7_9ACTN|nr:winged helix-turn-helix domain-containing protein [Streptomyces sp. DSM 41699]MDT0466276.1 winged helix-turn-helix domain-containing protein [Streptomyces sp. DSM 41699]
MTGRKDAGAAGLAALAGLIADETRAACLLALLDGRAWTASELARHAGVAASTLSEHLGRLVAGGLLTEERQGRHRYVRLAGPQVAQLVEELAAQVEPGVRAARRRTLRASGAAAAMAHGRTCYDHLAGRLGIAVADAFTARGLLRQDTGFALTDAGLRWFDTAGIGLDRTGRRPLVRSCLDWTERRPHLAGVAGAALCRHALDAGWCVRIGSERAVRVTAEGERALSALLGIEAAALR